MKSIRVGEIVYPDDLVAARESEVIKSATCYSEDLDIIYIFEKDDETWTVKQDEKVSFSKA